MIRYECNKCGKTTHTKNPPLYCQGKGCDGVYDKKEIELAEEDTYDNFADFYSQSSKYIQTLRKRDNLEIIFTCDNIKQHKSPSLLTYCVPITDDVSELDFDCPNCGEVPWEG